MNKNNSNKKNIYIKKKTSDQKTLTIHKLDEPNTHADHMHSEKPGVAFAQNKVQLQRLGATQCLR